MIFNTYYIALFFYKTKERQYAPLKSTTQNTINMTIKHTLQFYHLPSN
jgi:hypothetical protein